jgi:hypothetical protein
MQHLLFGIISAVVGLNLLAVSAAQEKGAFPTIDTIQKQNTNSQEQLHYLIDQDSSTSSNSEVTSAPAITLVPPVIPTSTESSYTIQETTTESDSSLEVNLSPTPSAFIESNVTPTATPTISITPTITPTPSTSIQLMPIHSEPTATPIMAACTEDPKLPKAEEKENSMVCL